MANGCMLVIGLFLAGVYHFGFSFIAALVLAIIIIVLIVMLLAKIFPVMNLMTYLRV